MRRPRVLVLITLAEVGGAQTYVATLLPALAERFDVVVAAHGPGPVRAAAAVASVAAFLAQAASSAPVTSSVASTVRPPASSRSWSWRRRSASRVATTTDAPSSIASRA